MSETGLYQVNGKAGNLGTPGAPILDFSILVDAPTGKITGHATINQAIAPPYGVKPISNLTGKVTYTGLGEYAKVVSMRGVYEEPLPGEAIGTVAVPFEAHFAINNAWEGKGGFSCGTLNVEDVPIAPTND